MSRSLRIALVSPYSWTYPGGVTRHIEALAVELIATGHHVRVLTPLDPPDRRSAGLHRGVPPQEREVPDWVIPLGRTVGFPLNGAVSNVSLSPSALVRLRNELHAGRYDVVHVHEPNAALVSWDATAAAPGALVTTQHCYSESPVSNGIAALAGAGRIFNRAHVRIAVSEAAAWTARRFYGGRYRIVPNGVHLRADACPGHRRGDPLRIVFVGQAVERKGLPVLLRAFEALRDHIPAELRLIGAGESDVAPLLHDRRNIAVLGPVSDEVKFAELAEADVLCAPSLGGESFGMVLTEAFAAATPVVASDIAGYRDVARDGIEGTLVPRGDPAALAEALRDLWHDPGRRERLAAGARIRAEFFAWPRVAREVVDCYEDALAVPRPVSAAHRFAAEAGAVPADGRPPVWPKRIPSPDPEARAARRPLVTWGRRVGLSAAAVGAGALAWQAVQGIGLDRVVASLVRSSPAWVLFTLALMCASMCVRAGAWHQLLRAALPRARVRLVDALQGTMIGVLMSATLPARLGEPSRAFVVARRVGRVRDELPAVLGTMVSQTVLNLVALAVLGVVMFSSIDVFSGREGALILAGAAPLFLLAVVVGGPLLLGRGKDPGAGDALRAVRGALAQVRSGVVAMIRDPRRGAVAAGAQLFAWALQWLACYGLLVGLGLDERAGLGAAAAVLFAVNVTAAVPTTPSNLGVFQAACVAVLAGAYGVSSADALAYGIVLQAVELTTAVVLGAPALVKEGLSWREVRLRALHAAPVRLEARRTEPAEA